MAQEKQQNLQDTFLNHLRKTKIPVTVFLVNGVKLHYVTQGKGKVMLFLHGFPEFWYEWKEQLPEFGKHYQAIALDMRGYNLSDKPSKVEDYAIPTLIADVKAFLDKVSKGKKAILVAHDWGGAIAWAFASGDMMAQDLDYIPMPKPVVELIAKTWAADIKNK